MATTRAQEVALKTNLLGWASTSANAGIEIGTGKKTTFQLFGTLNPWKFSGDKKMRFWNVMPEYRWYTCQKFGGHFFGIHALGGEYNIKNIDMPFGILPKTLEGRHYEGWYVGGGLTYGYQWLLNKHLNFEGSIGLGYAYSPYKLYGRCEITSTIDLVKNDKNVEITDIDIHGFASPDGSYANNKRLANERAAALRNYVSSLYTINSKLFKQ